MQAFPKSRWSKQSMSSVERDLHPLTGDCVNGGTRSTKRKYLDTRYSTKWGEDSIYCSQFENIGNSIRYDYSWHRLTTILPVIIIIKTHVPLREIFIVRYTSSVFWLQLRNISFTDFAILLSIFMISFICDRLVSFSGFLHQ